MRATLVGLAVAMAAVSVVAWAPQPRGQACPVPRATLWSVIPNADWPRLAHRSGDDRWAHRDSVALPRDVAAWCNPAATDRQAIAAGRQLYDQMECASCHGDAGRGDGPGGAVADPAPYDFTRPEFAGMREPPGPALLYAILTQGIEGTTMQGYADRLSAWERLALIAYLTSLPGPDAVRNSRAWADTLRARRN